MSDLFPLAEPRLIEAIYDIRHEMTRPSVLYRASVFQDGNMFCCLYGENLQEGLAAYGETPAEAVHNFDFYVWQGRPVPEKKRAVADEIAAARGPVAAMAAEGLLP